MKSCSPLASRLMGPGKFSGSQTLGNKFHPSPCSPPHLFGSPISKGFIICALLLCPSSSLDKALGAAAFSVHGFLKSRVHLQRYINNYGSLLPLEFHAAISILCIFLHAGTFSLLLCGYDAPGHRPNHSLLHPSKSVSRTKSQWGLWEGGRSPAEPPQAAPSDGSAAMPCWAGVFPGLLNPRMRRKSWAKSEATMGAGPIANVQINAPHKA